MLIGQTTSSSQVPQLVPAWIVLIGAVAWPLVALIALFIFRRPAKSILQILEKRIEGGASVKFYSVEVGQAPANLPIPAKGEAITSNHLALLHSSWRYPKKDSEFGRRMWAFHVIVKARDEVLDRIEYVKYTLDRSYPNPVQSVTDRASCFKLKELANGESTVKAEIRIKGQEEPILLSRYINLTDTGPRI